MEPVDEPIEHDARDEIGILEADLQARDSLLALAIDFLLFERRIPHHIGQQIEAKRQAVLHHDHVGEAEVVTRARVQPAADRIDRVGDLLGRTRGRPLVEERGRKRRDAALPRCIADTPRLQQQPQGHHGLLVMHHHDHAHAIRQGADLVRRKIHIPCGERARRVLGPASPSPARRPPHGQATSGEGAPRISAARARPGRLPWSMCIMRVIRPGAREPAPTYCVWPRGRMVITSRLLRVK